MSSKKRELDPNKNRNIDNSTFSSSSSSSPSSNNNTSKPTRLRPSQACDRCRSKKIRCDLKQPQCSACFSVGFECKFTDKLLRKTYPRGYTESLEERIRELEAENRKLSALSDMKQQQINYLQQQKQNDKNDPLCISSHPVDHILSSTNPDMTIQNSQPCASAVSDSSHVCDGICLQRTLHPQPVATSFNLNDPTSISFEQDKAPGLLAAKALDLLSNHEESTQLAMLVSLSVPRSTEEILFVPQLLSKIRQQYGFTSKQCLYSVTLLPSLKDDLPPPFLQQNSTMLLNSSMDLDTLINKNLWQIQNLYYFINTILKLNILPNLKSDPVSNKGPDIPEMEKNQFYLTFDEIDHLISLFMDHWSQLIPVLNKNDFMNDYAKFKKDIDSLQQHPVPEQPIINLLNIKYFACLLVALCQMGLIIEFKESRKPVTSKFSKLLSYYHHILHLLPRNSFFSVTTTSVRTLQLLSLLLYYFLNTGDIIQLYDLRGTIVTMSQQLRLHRCPSAVLTGSGQKMQKLEQSNRRRLFWCIYYLDVFASFQLGVPRLLKDHEIECALPFALEDTINSTNKVKLEGCVTNFSLAIIRFAKVMGNILDSIFKRTATTNDVVQIAIIHENALDGWRKSLPLEYQMELDVTGKTKLENLTFEKSLLIILYQLAKCMIQLPICAAAAIPILSDDPSTNVNIKTLPSYTALQQSVFSLLKIYGQLRDKYIPLPVNTSRIMTRFALIGAKESLEYTKYGKSFESNKEFLLNVVSEIEVNRRLELPGVISWYSLEILDLTINLILQTPALKGEKLEKFLQKKIDYYQTQMGITPISNITNSTEKRSKKRSSSIKTEAHKNKKKSKIFNKSKNNDTTTTTAAATSIINQKNKTDNSDNNNNNNCDTLHIFHENDKISKKPIDTSQNQLLEALQDDPILNGNPYRFSNLNLSNFFGSYIRLNEKISTDNIENATIATTTTNNNKITTVPPSLSNSINTVNSTTSPSYFAETNLYNLNNRESNLLTSHLSSISFSNLLPLTGNDGSLSQFNLNMLYDTGNLFESISSENNNLTNNKYSDNRGNEALSNNTINNSNDTNNINVSTDFSSIIDASLGLAPLLLDTTNVNGTRNDDNTHKVDTSCNDLIHPEMNETAHTSNPSNTNTNNNNNVHLAYPIKQPIGRERRRQVIEDISKWQNQ